MSIILYLIFSLAILTVIACFLNYKLAIGLYIAFLILVPYPKIELFGIVIPIKAGLNFILLLSFFYQYQIKQKVKSQNNTIRPFIFLFLSLLFLSIFTNTVPWEFQLYLWSSTLIATIVLPYIIFNTASYESDLFDYLKWSILISISIACIYGIFLKQLGGLNPYTMFLAQNIGVNDASAIYSEALAMLNINNIGKIQSTMIHPMTWALSLCFFLFIIVLFYFKNKNKLYFIFIAILLFNLFTCGVRTGIIALLFGLLYFLFRKRSIKLILYLSFLCISTYIVVVSNKDLSKFAYSFSEINSNSYDSQGSSISMRLNQLDGAIDVIEGSELVGKGYGWTKYYLANNTSHPVLLAFESLLFVILCNSGIIGLFIWLTFFLLLFKLQRKVLENKTAIYLMDTLVIIFASYSIGTGEYGYLELFAIYYSISICYLIKNENGK